MSAVAGIVALAASGCSSDEKKTPPVGVESKVKLSDLVEEFKPIIQTASTANIKISEPEGSNSAGLIEPTNSTVYTKKIDSGRSDPFASLFSLPVEKVSIKQQKNPLSKVQAPVRKLPPPPPASMPPVKSEPNLVSGIAVQGVVTVGERSHAIVKLPNEKTSRYVSEGQNLSGKKVLVKKINISPDVEPVVILEQDGIEIVKSVGVESTIAPIQTTSSTISGASLAKDSAQLHNDTLPLSKLPNTARQLNREPLQLAANASSPVEKTETNLLAVPYLPPNSSSLENSSSLPSNIRSPNSELAEPSLQFRALKPGKQSRSDDKLRKRHRLISKLRHFSRNSFPTLESNTGKQQHEQRLPQSTSILKPLHTLPLAAPLENKRHYREELISRLRQSN